MSYTAKEWVAGDDISISDLNNIEGGINNAANPFVVTLTPTAQDFSGTMDKTVAEIYEAYQAGKKISFRMYSSATEYGESDLNYVGYDTNYSYPSFNGAALLGDMNILLYIYTGITNNGTTQTYSTIIYPLTPLS